MRQRQRDLSPDGSLPKWLPQKKLGQAGARSVKLQPDLLPCWVWGPKRLGHRWPLPQVPWQEAEWEMEQSGVDWPSPAALPHGPSKGSFHAPTLQISKLSFSDVGQLGQVYKLKLSSCDSHPALLTGSVNLTFRSHFFPCSFLRVFCRSCPCQVFFLWP